MYVNVRPFQTLKHISWISMSSWSLLARARMTRSAGVGQFMSCQATLSEFQWSRTLSQPAGQHAQGLSVAFTLAVRQRHQYHINMYLYIYICVCVCFIYILKSYIDLIQQFQIQNNNTKICELRKKLLVWWICHQQIRWPPIGSQGFVCSGH